jgi:two-component system, chemotaxis family, sensor kinase CheA
MADFDPTAKFKVTYFQECDELLLEMERLASSLRPDDSEALNALFRAVHTVKGGAGMFNFNRLVAFAHVLETVLENVRAGTLVAEPSTISEILRGCDILADLVQEARGATKLPDSHEATSVENLKRLVSSNGIVMPAPKELAEADQGDGNKTIARHVIRFFPSPGLFRRGSEPQLIFRELAELGNIHVTPDVSKLPAFDELDPASCHIGWTITIATHVSIDRLKQVFAFVEGDGTVAFLPERRQRAREQQVIAPAVTSSRAVNTIRVDLDRVDKLVNQVGEIAIVQAMIDQQSGPDLNLSHPLLGQAISQLSQLVQSLQDSVMAIRAVPVGTVFARMTRLVRELATATGKQVALDVSGEETEIDKTVIEQLGDPLMHMIRNAVDHGIERPADRELAGKRPMGRVQLNASQRGGQIVIEIIDDGRGLDAELIRKKAIERGLIAEAALMSEDEILALIFQPGFSTAETVSDISGRGVGMDVVKRNIQKLGGRVLVKSDKGSGTRFTISLPLTLAILSGMVVRSGAGYYVISLSNILECLQAQPGFIKTLPGTGEVFRYRDQYVPLVRLGAVFNAATSADMEMPLVIVVEDEDGNVLGIAVDEIAGQQQVVIKSLRDNLDQVHGISGATILGNGTVALILIISDLLELHKSRGASRIGAPAFSQSNTLQQLIA